MKRPAALSNNAGFTLLELMISLVLGLMLLAGAVATYLASQRSYSETEQFSTLSDNARFAELTMADALLHAGFFGEASPLDVAQGTVASPSSSSDCGGPASSNGKGSANVYNFERYIFGATIGSNQKARAENTDLECITDGRVGTDVLVIKRAIPSPYTDGARINPVRDGKIDTPSYPRTDTLYVLSNNVRGVLFRGDGTGTTHPSIGVGGQVYHGIAWPYLYETYYIRDKDPASEKDPPVLARKTLIWDAATTAMVLTTEDLVEGVENMQLQIGFDSNDDGEIDSYSAVTSDNSGMINANWSRAGSVEVSLVVRSSTNDPQFVDAKTYDLGGGASYTPVQGSSDVDLRQFHRLRINTQASLRNPKMLLRR